MPRRIRPRAAVLAFLVCASGPTAVSLLCSSDAHASVSIAVTWDALLKQSSSAVVVTPVESRAVWEDGRIYTYTHLRVDRGVAGELTAGADAWVRTMGGVVGKVGQLVEGEPVFVPAQPSLVFLHAGPVGAFEVTARGQGQFPIVADDPKLPPRIVRSHSVGALMAPRTPPSSSSGTAGARLAADVIHGRPVDDVARDVASAWSATHAR
jgi:hypothetical protein